MDDALRFMVEEPAIAFGPWAPWCGGRKSLRSSDGRASIGVYVWGRFVEPPSATARPWPDIPEELIYAGETNNLNRRPLSGNVHHRLVHYRARFADDQDLALLYVSVFHIEPFQRGEGRSRVLRAFTRYVEDLIYWEYARRFGRRAALDYKKGKGGP